MLGSLVAAFFEGIVTGTDNGQPCVFFDDLIKFFFDLLDRSTSTRSFDTRLLQDNFSINNLNDRCSSGGFWFVISSCALLLLLLGGRIVIIIVVVSLRTGLTSWQFGLLAFKGCAKGRESNSIGIFSLQLLQDILIFRRLQCCHSSSGGRWYSRGCRL